MAVFEGPGTAVRHGLRYLSGHPGAGLAVHVAEVAVEGELGGHGVAGARALADLAPAGALLASAGVRDLLSGSNVVLVPDGTRHPARAGGHAGVPSDSLAEPRLQTGCTDTSDRRTVAGTVMARAELEGAFVVSAGEDGQPLLVAEQVSKVYRTGEIEVQALAELNLAVNRGELVAVMGPSGSGKTTLLNCLSGLDDIDGGRVLLEGRDLFAMSDAARTTHRAKAMGFIFQSFNLIPVFTAVENVELPLLLGGTPARQARKRATEMLTRVGLGQRTGHRPNELSGGEQQRVTIARALASRPAIVWADEPTGNLDSQMADQVVELLHELNEVDGQTILLVTHDAGIGASAGRLIHMRDGRLVRDEVQVGAGTAPDGHGVMLHDSGA